MNNYSLGMFGSHLNALHYHLGQLIVIADEEEYSATVKYLKKCNDMLDVLEQLYEWCLVNGNKLLD